MRRVSAIAEPVLPTTPPSLIHIGFFEGAAAVSSLSSTAWVKNWLRVIPRERANTFARRSVLPGISTVVFTRAIYLRCSRSSAHSILLRREGRKRWNHAREGQRKIRRGRRRRKRGLFRSRIG